MKILRNLRCAGYEWQLFACDSALMLRPVSVLVNKNDENDKHIPPFSFQESPLELFPEIPTILVYNFNTIL